MEIRFKLKQITLSAILLVALAINLVSCHKDNEPPVSTETEKTLFMYMPWSTDLKGAFYTNISDMEKAIAKKGLDRERVLVFISTTATEATLFEIIEENGKCKGDTLKRYTNPALTTKEGITSILNDVKGFAPANRYAMTIGCHGMGWLPVSRGRTRLLSREKLHWEYEGVPKTRYFGGKTSEYQTDITTLAEGIADAGMKMEYILFDDCYMSSIEVAYDLRGVTDFVIGSPCEIMFYGMPYAEIGEHLLGDTDYKAIYDKFHTFYSNYKEMPCGTIGVTDCSELAPLVQIMKEINNRYRFDETEISSIQTLDGYSPTLFFDLGDYVAKLCSDTDLLNQFQQQLQRTVPYKRHTDTYYTMTPRGRQIKINAFSGVTVSDPSLNSLAETKNETAWYKATH